MNLKNLETLKEELHRPSLGNLKDYKNIIGCEIGTQYGVNARDILEKYDIKTLYLVDPYVLYPGITGNIAGKDCEEAKETAHNYLSEFKDKIIWIEDYSWNAVDFIPDNLDFIYIDGDHRYEPLKSDLEAYYPKVRNGGLFAGHDYDERAPSVLKAVNEFFKYKEEILYAHGKWDWYIVKGNKKIIYELRRFRVKL